MFSLEQCEHLLYSKRVHLITEQFEGRRFPHQKRRETNTEQFKHNLIPTR